MEDRFKNRTQFFINPGKEKRAEFLDFLESEGFVCDAPLGREDVLESFLPVLVETEKKTFRTMGNVTNAACAASAKLITNDEKFYELYAELQSVH